jgi:hypothetical protein
MAWKNLVAFFILGISVYALIIYLTQYILLVSVRDCEGLAAIEIERLLIYVYEIMVRN